MTPESTTLAIAYIGLGGNLDRPLDTLASARRMIAGLARVRETAFSSFYRSAPMGPANQPDYINAVMAVETSLPPLALLKAMQRVELSHGRVRNGLRWGPRTLDLDILIYGKLHITDEGLTLPHAGIADREFVLYPLAEIAPTDLEIPGMGRLCDLLIACPRRGLDVVVHG